MRVVYCAAASVLLALSITGWAANVQAKDLSPESKAALCTERDGRLARDRDEARVLDPKLSRMRSFEQRYDDKSTAQLEAELALMNRMLREGGLGAAFEGKLLALRDYIASLEAWKVTGKLVVKPKMPAGFSNEVDAMDRHRVELARQISLLEEERQSLGCDQGAPTIINLSGAWCSREHPHSHELSTSIDQDGGNLTFHNEHDDTSTGHVISDGEVVADEWVGGLHASVADGGRRLNWANGSVWRKSANCAN